MSKEIPPSIYFGGAACGSSYFIGVAKKMSETWGHDFPTKTLICGDSIGAVIAFQLAIGLSVEDITLHAKNIFRKMQQDPHYWTGQNFWIDKYVDDLLENDPEIYKKLEGKYMCGTTREFFNHQWHVKWESNEDLAKCIKGSYNIPLYCSHSDRIYGMEVLDGAYGFDDSCFPHGNNTLFVGANQTCAEINFNLTVKQMLIPDIHEEFAFLHKNGEEAFDKWDETMIDKKGKRSPNYPMLVVCWVGKYLQILYEMLCIHVINDKTQNDLF